MREIKYIKAEGQLKKWSSGIKSQKLLIFLFMAFLIMGSKSVLWAQFVEVDNTSSTFVITTGTTLTFSHTSSSNANRLLLVGISNKERDVTAVTYNGAALSQWGEERSVKNAYTEIWYMSNPPSGTADIVITFDNNNSKGVIAGAMTFSGVNQIIPLGAYVSARAKTATPTLDVPSRSSDLIFNVVAMRNRDLTSVGTGQTEVWNHSTGSEMRGGGTSKPGEATSTNVYWTASGSDDWSMSGVSVRPLATSDVRITKTANTTTPILGDDIIFTLTANNAGPDAATNVSVTDILPSGFSYVSHSTAVGIFNPSTGIWDIGNLANGTAVNLTITATVDCSDNYRNIATITATQPDPNESNNSSILSITPINTIPTTYDICFGETFDLSGLAPCNQPVGTVVTWHSADPATTENEILDVSALGGGTYYVAFHDHINDCYSPTTAFTINENPEITLTGTTSDVDCYGANNGIININVSGGNPGISPDPAYTYSWVGPNGFTSTDEDLSGLEPGSYTVTVTDSKGCTKQESFGIYGPEPLTATTSVTNVLCFGNSTGAIQLTVNGGTKPYSYFWTGPNGFNSVSEDISGLEAGTYTLTISDANSCVLVVSRVITQPANPLNVTISTVDPTCFLNGSLTLAVSGGTAPYTYDWSDLTGSNNVKDRSGLVAGTYYVDVTDANGCTYPTVSATLTAPTDCAPTDICQSEGAAVFSVDPDPDNISYVWSVSPAGPEIISGQGTPSVVVNWNNADPGVYSLCVYSETVCGGSDEICLEINVKSVTASAGVIDPVCEGGLIQLWADGGQSYLWTGPNNFQSTNPNPVIYNASFADNGIYSVAVTSDNGCTVTYDVNVTVNESPVISSAISSYATCGSANGTIDIEVSGGIGPYSYLWSTGATTQDLSDAPAGNYWVQVTDDATGCTVESTHSISNVEIGVTIVLAAQISCNGGSDGAIDLTATLASGIPDFIYEWTGPYGYTSTTEDLTGIPAGTYSVMVTDQITGCSGAGSITLDEPEPLELDYTKQDVTCFGGSNGSLNLIVRGGIGLINYYWEKDGLPFGVTTQDLSNLSIGTYTVTVTDANGCVATLSATIEQPLDGIQATETVTDVGCFGESTGQIILSVSGGTAPYTYFWTSTGGGVIPAGQETNKNLTGLSSGLYTVVITDGTGICNITVSDIVVGQPAVPLTISATGSDVSCYGGLDGFIDLNISGGTAPYFINWSNGEITEDISGLSAGTYSVIVTDNNGCEETLSIVIGQPALLTASILVTDVDCYGAATGSIVLTVEGGNGGETFLWSNGSTTQNLIGVEAGYYSVTVTDGLGCIVKTNATISEPPTITAIADVTNVLCYGGLTGEINITASGGTGALTYTWSTSDGNGLVVNDEDQTGLTAGTYTVLIEDENGCSLTKNYTISEPAVIVLSMENSNISCHYGNDGSINLSVSGGVAPYSYLWSDGTITQDITGLVAGTYFVTVTDANGCVAFMTSDPITEPTTLRVTAYVDENVTCLGGNDGAASAGATGGTPPYSYLWSNGSTLESPTNFTAGTFNVVVTDSKGCIASSSVIITEPESEMELFATTTLSSSCGGSTGAINLTVADVADYPPYSFSWTGPTAIGNIEDPTGLASGIYEVLVTNGIGCTQSLSIEVQTAPALTVSITAYDPTCVQNQDGSIDPDPATGEVYAIVTGGVGPYTYSWDDAGSSTTQGVTGLTADVYSVTITDVNGCTASNTVTLNLPDCNPPLAVSDTFTSCGEDISGTVALNDSDIDNLITELEFLPLMLPNSATEGTLTWDPSYDGSFTFSPVAGFDGTIVISYIVEDPIGLSDVDTLVLQISSVEVEVTAENTGHVECGASDGWATLTHTGGFAPYSFSDDDITYVASPAFNGLSAGVHTFYVKDRNGCIAPIDVTIEDVCLSITKILYSINGNTLVEKYNAEGDTIQYAIEVINTGTTDLTDVLVTDPLTGLSQTIALLSAGNSQTIYESYFVTDQDLIIGSVLNTAYADYSYNGISYTKNDSETVEVGNADLVTVKTLISGDGTPNEGDTVTFLITVTNNGPAPANNATLNDLLPAGLTATPSPPGNNGITSQGSYDALSGIWTIGNLSSGSFATLTLEGTVDAGQAGNTILNTTTKAVSDQSDPTDAGNDLDESVTVNSPPVAVIDLYTLSEDDLAVTLPVVSDNDYDIDGNLDPATTDTTCALCYGTVNGTLINNNDGTFSYTPDAQFYGQDSFVYQVCDLDGLCDTAVVYITIGAVNDIPLAADDNEIIDEDSGTLNSYVWNNDNESADGGNLWSLVDSTSNGELIFHEDGNYEYTPDAEWYGTETFTYALCDSTVPQSDCDTATVTITVLPVNDIPAAADDSETMTEDGGTLTASVTGNDTPSTDGGNVWSLVDSTANGELTFNEDGSYDYTPHENWYGTEIFTYALCDSTIPQSDCDTAAVTITVEPENDPPVAVVDAYTVNEDDPAITLNVVGDNDYDIDGNLDVTSADTTCAICFGPDNGTLVNNGDGTFEYTPDQEFNGQDTFVYQVCDSLGLCDTAIVVITIASVNDLPIANNDSAHNTAPVSASNPTTIELIGDNDTDSDGTIDPATVDLDPASSGIQSYLSNSDGIYVVDESGNVTFTPSAGLTRDPTPITYTIQDNEGGTSNVATLSITYGYAPLANDDSAHNTAPVSDTNPTTTDLLGGNDTDSDGTVDASTIDLDPSTPGIQDSLINSDGTYVVDDLGYVTFTPDAGLTTDPAPITYTIQDNDGNTSNEAALTITYGYAPVANDDGEHNTAPVSETNPTTIDLIGSNDTDADGTVDASTIDLDASIPGIQDTLINSDGTYVVDALGNVTFTPDAGLMTDPTPVTYTIEDTDGNISNEALLTITYGYAPVANDDSAHNTAPVSGSNPTTINVVGANDTDADGTVDGSEVDLDPSSPGIQSTLTNGDGTYDVDALGNVTFTPDDTLTIDPAPITYTIKDNDGNTSNEATLTITYGFAPVASSNEDLDNISGTAVTQQVIFENDGDGIDSDPDGFIALGSVDLNPATLDVNDKVLVVPGEGTWLEDGSGNVTFLPFAGFNDDPTPISYIVEDNNGNESNIATITVDYLPVSADDNSLGNTAGSTVIIDVTLNDTPGDVVDTTTVDLDETSIAGAICQNSDVDGDCVEVYVPGEGTWLVDEVTGEVSFTPELGYNGDPTPIEYTVDDHEGNATQAATISIDYEYYPIANSDTTFTEFNTPVSGTAASNDVPSGDGGNLWSLVGPDGGALHGTVSMDALGNYIYTPDPDWSGTDVFTYQLCDINGDCDEATVTVVTGPLAEDDLRVTPFDVTISDGDIRPNDYYPAGSTFNLLADSTTNDGTLSLNPDGTYTFDPDPDFSGTTIFTYEVCFTESGSEYCDSATATIVVGPDALEDSVATSSDTPVSGNVTGNDTAPEGSTYQTYTGPLNGSVVINPDGTFTYTPDPGFTGTDQFEYEVCFTEQGIEVCDIATVTVTVLPDIQVNDQVVFEGDPLLFEITLSAASTTPVTFIPDFTNVSTSDDDYTQSPVSYSVDGGTTWLSWTGGEITIPAGITEVVFIVLSTEDLADESTEVFNLNLTVTSGNTSNGTDTGTGTILDDETVISGTVFNDANGLDDNTVNGVPSDGGGIWANLVDPLSDLVIASVLVAPDGSYSFHDGVNQNTTYLVILSSEEQAAGSTLTTATLPANWGSAGENIGLVAGNDGTVDSKILVTTGIEGVTDVNFGIIMVPDVTPVITVIPNVMHGQTQFNVTVRVTELNVLATQGTIIVKIPKDTRWILSPAYNSAATTVGTIAVSNANWTFGEDSNYYILTSDEVIPAGEYSTFGFQAVFDPGQTKGLYTITAQIVSGSGGESRVDNNVDAEKIDYFIY